MLFLLILMDDGVVLLRAVFVKMFGDAEGSNYIPDKVTRMNKRKIITIDKSKCNGCGKCVDACAEGAIEIIDGKAALVADVLCDGFGDCLGECPTGALVVKELDVPDFDPDATREHLQKTRGKTGVDRFEQAHERHTQNNLHSKSAEANENPGPSHGPAGGGCPGMMAREMKRTEKASADSGKTTSGESRLQNWPIQLHLISPAAPALREADLLIAADCTAFAVGAFHDELLRGHTLVIACPKLDDTQSYPEKLARIIADNHLASLTVVRMEVPCCSGLTRLVAAARDASGVTIPIREVIIGIQNGEILSRKVI